MLAAARGSEMNLSAIDPAAIFNRFNEELNQRIQAGDLPGVLAFYDTKGLLADAATLLGPRDQRSLIEKVSRLLGPDQGKDLARELAKALPSIPE